MLKKVNEDRDRMYKGIVRTVWGNRRIISCDLCAEVSAGVCARSQILVRHRMFIVYFALVEVTWLGTCCLCGQRYYADLAS